MGCRHPELLLLVSVVKKNQLEPTWPKFVSALRMVLFSGLGPDAQNQVIVCALFFCITVFKFYGS